MKQKFSLLILLVSIIFIVGVMPVYAATSDVTDSVANISNGEVTSAEFEDSKDAEESDSNATKALSAGIAISVAAVAGAVAMGYAISKSAESVARQPEAAGNIRASLLVGLVFIETTIIYAFVVAILIIFVL